MKSALLLAVLMATTADALSVNQATNRRSVFGGIAATTAAAILVAPTQAALAVDVPEFNVFNSLIFNYRGGGFNGLDASTLDEPSIPFLEFGSRLQKGDVAFVELFAPDGDVAYATLRNPEDGKDEKPIRIGEGFPIEQHDGYSSPAFVVRALKNYNVPYKFTVPGLEKYSTM